MSTTITIGYNADSFSRKMRLMNAFQTANKKCESSSADLQKKVAGLSDSDGELTIVWAVLPTRYEIDAFREAWTSAGEKGDRVTHVWLGMPDKPIMKSAKVDSSSLNSLCKKVADNYYREYLQENEKSTKQPETSPFAPGKESKIPYEPQWNEAQKDYLKQIDDKA